MYQIPIHPLMKNSRYLLCVGAILTLIGVYNPLTLWIAIIGTIIFIIGFALQLYMNRLVSKYRVKSSLGIDFLFPETDNWHVAPKYVGMPEEEVPTEIALTEAEIAGLVHLIQTRSRKRRDAAGQLAVAGISVIPHLEPLFQEEHPEVRLLAASIIRYIGPRATEAVPSLITALSDKDALVRAQVICALARIGQPARKALSRLLDTLNDIDDDIRICSAIAIGRILAKEDAGKNVIRSLKKLQDDPVISVQAAAAISLHELGQKDTSIINALIKGLRDRNAVLALLCTESLGLIGAPAQAALPELLEALSTPHPVIQIKVSHALYRLGYDTMPLLRPILLAGRTGEIYVRLEALEILEELGVKGEQAIPAYVRMLTDRNTLTRVFAVRGISFLGEEARSVVPQLRRALLDPAKAIQYHAQKILETLGEPLEEPKEESEEDINEAKPQET